MGRTVLLVEENPQQRAMCRHCLQESGYQVLEAEDMAEAVALVREERPGLLVLTAHLQEAKEVVALQEIKRIHKSISVVLQTTSSLHDNDLRYGLADACIVKSRNSEGLRRAIREVVEREARID